MKCTHCENEEGMEHQDEHPGLCCDCLDLSYGMPLKQINAERAERGEKPITKPWKTR